MVNEPIMRSTSVPTLKLLGLFLLSSWSAQQRTVVWQLHPQSPLHRLEAESSVGDRLTIEVDL